MIKLCVQRAFLRPAAVKQLLSAASRASPPGAAGGVTGGAVSPHGAPVMAPGCCWMGTHGRKEPKETLNNPKSAKEFIYRLKPNERTCLLRELQAFESVAIAQETVAASPPTSAQIRYVLIHNCLPFIGFGFLDNAIMIAAGTQIELSIGVTLGISTMAAAALGNLVSDLAGLGLAGYVEALVSRLGMTSAELTPKQADMWQTRLSSHLGKAIGVTIGCILGMFPLLFLSEEEDDKPTEPKAVTTDS